MLTLESGTLLQLLNSDTASPRTVVQKLSQSDLGGYEPLIQLIQREGLDRIDGDFLEIGNFVSGETARLPKLSAFLEKHVRIIRRDSLKAALPQGTRLAFAFIDGNSSPSSVADEFRLVFKHLAPGGWAAFQGYAGESSEVTTALNTMLTEHSTAIDRVERIKAKQVLLVRKRPVVKSPTA
jgi:hypothetical protein